MVRCPQHAGHVRDARVDRLGRQATQGRYRHLLRRPLIRNSVVIMPRPEPNCSCIRRPRPATHGIANPGSYTDRDGLCSDHRQRMGPDGYPLDVDGNLIYFVDENGDTVSSSKDTAVYNCAGVGSDPFPHVEPHHQRMERQGRHPV